MKPVKVENEYQKQVSFGTKTQPRAFKQLPELVISEEEAEETPLNGEVSSESESFFDD